MRAREGSYVEGTPGHHGKASKPKSAGSLTTNATSPPEGRGGGPAHIFGLGRPASQLREHERGQSMGEHEYVEDNPLYAEPATGEFDEDENLVRNVRELVANLHKGTVTYTQAARYVASFDEEVGNPGATYALLLVQQTDDDKAIADGIAALRKG